MSGKRGKRGKGKTTKTNVSGRISQSARAGLSMPVSRVRRNMRLNRCAEHIGRTGAVYMTAVLEYCLAEILELAGNAAKDNKRKTINNRHIMMAIKTDDEFNRFMSNVTIKESGVLPHIHQVLLKKKKKYKKTAGGTVYTSAQKK